MKQYLPFLLLISSALSTQLHSSVKEYRDSFPLHNLQKKTALILIPSFSANKPQSKTFEMIENILDIQMKEIHFLSDFKNCKQKVLLSEMMELLKIPIVTDHILPTTDTMLVNQTATQYGNCSELPPLYSDERKQSIFFVVWVDNMNLQVVLNLFAKSVYNCSKEQLAIRAGNYNKDNSFLFIIDTDLGLASSIIFDNDMIQKHQHVALAFKHGDESFRIFNYNPYMKQVKANVLWSKDSAFKKMSDIFPIFDMNGHTLHLGGTPYSANLIPSDNPDDPMNGSMVAINVTGYEIDMMETLSKKLNFTYEMYLDVSPVFVDGEWASTGACVNSGRCDAVIGGILLTYQSIGLYTAIIFNDWLTFASPKPARYINFLTLISPLTYGVWIGSLISLVAMACCLMWISRMGGRWYGQQIEDWSSLSSTLFYVIGMTFSERYIGHREKLSVIPGSGALRGAMTAWMVGAFIIVAGYNGALRTFLLAPSLEKVIETFDDVLESSIPWGMLLYGLATEDDMAKDEDPTVKRIWNGKSVISVEKWITNSTEVLEQVLNRKMIVMQYQSDLSCQAFVGFTTPNGESLIHISKVHFTYDVPNSWGFHTFNPWFDRFHKHVRHMIEGGLIDQMKMRTMRQMKKDAAIKRVIQDDPDVQPLTFDEFGFLFIMLTVVYFLLVAYFIFEIVHARKSWAWITARWPQPISNVQTLQTI